MGVLYTAGTEDGVQETRKGPFVESGFMTTKTSNTKIKSTYEAFL